MRHKYTEWADIVDNGHYLLKFRHQLYVRVDDMNMNTYENLSRNKLNPIEPINWR